MPMTTSPSAFLRITSRHRRLDHFVCSARVVLSFLGLHFAGARLPWASLSSWLLSMLFMMVSVGVLSNRPQQSLPPFWQCIQSTSPSTTPVSKPMLSLKILLHAAASVVLNTTIWVAVADVASDNGTVVSTALICILVSLEWFTVTLSLLSTAAYDALQNDKKRHIHVGVLARFLQLCYGRTIIGYIIFCTGIVGWLAAPLVAYTSALPSRAIVEIPPVLVYAIVAARALAFLVELAQCHCHLQQVVWSDVQAVNLRNGFTPATHNNRETPKQN